MNVKEAYEQARQICGEPPPQPVLRDVPDTSTDDIEVNGVVVPGRHDPIQQDPNNSLLIEAWKAELVAYNELFDKVVERLLKE